MLLARYWTDPFAYLGMHAEDGGLTIRASLPNASTRAFVRARGLGATPRTALESTTTVCSSCGFPATTVLRLRVCRRRARRTPGDRRRRTASARFSAKSTPISLPKASITGFGRCSAIAAAHDRRRCRCRRLPFGRPTRGASASSAISTIGTDGAIRCANASNAACGRFSFPASRPALATSTKSKARTEICSRSRPIRSRATPRLRPANASIVHAIRGLPSGTTTPGCATRGARQRADAPISVYEVHLGSWRRRANEGDRFSQLSRARRGAAPVRRRHGLHARRTVADHGTSVRRIVGIPADRDVRANEPLRTPARFSAPSSTPRTAWESASSSTGCRAIFRTIRTASRSSTARTSTSTTIRARASIPTGTR